MTTQALFTPLQLGPMNLKHRVVMAPLTRNRSEQPGDVPGEPVRRNDELVSPDKRRF